MFEVIHERKIKSAKIIVEYYDGETKEIIMPEPIAVSTERVANIIGDGFSNFYEPTSIYTLRIDYRA